MSARRFQLIFMALSITACAPESPYPEGVTAEMIAEGQELFENRGFCWVCHGEDAAGGMGADLTDEEWWHSDGSYEGILATVINGVTGEQSVRGPQSTMEPRGGTQLSDEQLAAVAAYVWSLRLEPVEATGSS